MQLAGHIKRYVAIALNQHFSAGRGHRQWRKANALEFEQNFWAFRQINHVQGEGLCTSTARVVVDLLVHQLVHGGDAVALHIQRGAARCGYHLAAYHQHPVFIAPDKFFHNHLAAALLVR